MSIKDADVPLPRDLPASAPVLNDIEGGRATPDRVAALRSAPGSGSATPVGSEHGSERRRRQKKEKGGVSTNDHRELVAGAGLMEDTQELPKNNMWIVMPRYVCCID